MEQASLIIGDGNWAVKSGSLLGYTMFNEQFYPQDITASRATTATRVNENGLVVTSSVDIARIDYSTGEAALLVEPQRTNLALRSEEFENASWFSSTGGVSVLPNQAIAPNGQNQMDLITFTGIGQNLIQTVSILNATQYTFSIWLATTSGTQTVQIGGIAIGIFNTVTVTTTPTRFTITSTSTSTTRFPGILSTGASSILAWGAQLEAGAYATSYIPTTATSVTRNADVTSKTGVSSLIGQTEGTIYAEIKVSKLLGAVSRYIFHLSDGTANNRIYMAFSGASSNILRGRIFSGGTLQCTIDSSTITSNGTYKLALAYKNNDIAFYINGVQIGVDTSATIPTGSRVDVGNNYAGASQFSDGISAASIRGTRLTNTQLAALTTL